jgi:hypothetical protein
MTKLAVDWWIRQRLGYIREAICWGFADHCYDIVETAFETNKEQNRWPTSWNTYWPAMGMSSSGNLNRKRHGSNATETHECLGIASLVDVLPPQLPPRNCDDWLLAAVLYICEDTPLKDAELFVSYSLYEFRNYRELQAQTKSSQRQAMNELPVSDLDIQQFASRFNVDACMAKTVITNIKSQLEQHL